MQAAFSRWAPALVAAVVTGAFALWNPPLRDLAAHTFRAEYFEQHGFAIWNGTWYGGHYLPAYSVLFPPLAALLSPVWVGAASAVASAHLFDGLVRTRWGERGALGRTVVRGARRRLRCSRTAGWCSRSALPSRSASLRALQLGRNRLAVALRWARRCRAPWRRCSSSRSRSSVVGTRRGRGAAARTRGRAGRGVAAGRARAAVPGGRRVPVLVLRLVAAGAVLRRSRCSRRGASEADRDVSAR